jgi:hypothetical protein
VLKSKKLRGSRRVMRDTSRAPDVVVVVFVGGGSRGGCAATILIKK